MALIRDYELVGTGFIVTGGYHVVTNISVEKRISDILPPADSSRADGLTANWADSLVDADWRSGYIASIDISIWTTKQSRLDEMMPIGQFNSSSRFKFMVDVDSTINYTQQAYNYLITTDYYSGSVQD
jgi:hypothetical protein